MKISDTERYIMTKDLDRLADLYKHKSETFTINHDLYLSIAENYRALASALKEGLTFREIA